MVSIDLAQAALSFARKNSFYLPTMQGSTSLIPWAENNSGTGADTVLNTSNVDPGYPGAMINITGTTTTGRSAAYLANMNIAGGQVWGSHMRFRDLATEAQDYIYRSGLTTSITDAAPTQGIWFEYDRSTSLNWRICSALAGTTKSTTSTAVVEDAWLELRCEILSDRSAVSFYVDDVLIGSVTETDDIPDGTALCRPANIMIKTAGTTSRIADFSLMYGFIAT